MSIISDIEYHMKEERNIGINVPREDMKLILDCIAVFKRVDSMLWYDPSDSVGGACGMCDANLHDNCIGKHSQLNGDPCPIQLVHDALSTLETGNV